MPPLSAAENPPDEAFHSTFEFQFRIPDSFKAAGSDRGYVETPGREAPYLDRVWTRNTDSISIRTFVVPEASWQPSPDQMFAGAKQAILTDPKLKLLSERDYIVGGCPTHSFVFAPEGDYAGFVRMDYILTQPDFNVIVFRSPEKTSLDDKPCTELFQSISIQPKTSVNKPQTSNKSFAANSHCPFSFNRQMG